MTTCGNLQHISVCDGVERSDEKREKSQYYTNAAILIAVTIQALKQSTYDYPYSLRLDSRELVALIFTSRFPVLHAYFFPGKETGDF
jgi:hypothetical protein